MSPSATIHMCGAGPQWAAWREVLGPAAGSAVDMVRISVRNRKDNRLTPDAGHRPVIPPPPLAVQLVGYDNVTSSLQADRQHRSPQCCVEKQKNCGTAASRAHERDGRK